MSRRVPDRLGQFAFRLFGRHVDSARHERDRTRFRALGLSHSFETHLLGQYALSWLVALAAGATGALAARNFLRSVQFSAPAIDGSGAVLAGSLAVGLFVGGLAKYLLRRGASLALEYLVRRRRTQIEHTLPGAVRYLHVTAAGTVDPARLFERIADNERVHGAMANSARRIRRRQQFTGSVESAIRREARDTPATESLAPFLLTFIERRREGDTALREFLADESRLLAVEDEQRHRREASYLRTVVGLFVLLLVGPLFLLLGLAGVSIVFPDTVPTALEFGRPQFDGLLAGVGSVGIVLLGAVAALFAFLLRPSGHRWAAPAPAQSPIAVLQSSPSNPTNALLVLLPVALGALGLGLLSGGAVSTLLLGAYVAVAVPTGLVDVRRARRRARIDRALPGFVHSLSERLESGRPLRQAVAEIATEESYGPLQEPIRKLAVDLKLVHGPTGGRTEALERFVGRIGTPFAGRTVGLAIGAIEAGADARTAVAHLQTETGRLVHADRARRSRFPVVILVGWTVALLIVAIVVAVNLMVLDTASPTGPVAGVTVTAMEAPGQKRPLFYVLTQATMLASGWFAGLTGRGVYEALLHSGVLVGITWVGFRLAGLV
ncbi:type II secretion system F family protein [Halodesulfurarchaeum sp. HSR-GB]|uniref:type II secretion system F family protein n=1 Tax=Halodesulfurarchaeum sp. HSR-GB TaxID=3074077 RepID=UPI002860D820|nr:type II secretion system F family protein [Halodesulfurarchaeum sp. HSR-GB]MDR5656725.1 type II secretion system F family protein [Halodesulfurarchaeum sp. HSR-GB]